MTLPRTLFLFTTAAVSTWAAPQAPKLETYAKLPLGFEANQGQTDPRVKYLARGLGYTSYLTGNEAVLVFAGSPTAVIRMKLAGALPAEPLGLDRLTGKSNYFIGNDPGKWRTGIPNFAKVQYPRVYPGIDLVYHGNQRQLEYDFVLAPGADAAAIRLQFAGARHIKIDSSGDLVLQVEGQAVRFHKPAVFQAGAGGGPQRQVEGRYRLCSNSEVAFQVGDYDRTKTLVIDPVLVRSTYLGGSGADIGYGIAVDGAGFTYVTGSTASATFPVVGCFQCVPGGGASDAFVTAFDPAGTAFLYSTFLGGSGTDVGRAIAVPYHFPGGPSPVFVAGSTTGGFPLIAPIQPVYGGGASDAFVTSLNPAGFPIYSTYLGGAGKDIAYGIAVDAGMNAYITGSTNSHNFPRFKCLQCVIGGGTDAFVTALPPPGAPFLYSTYLGGQGNDIAYGISTDNLGDVGITGSTTSPNFPVVHPCAQCVIGGGTDAFISFLTSRAGGPPALTWSTYWGGGGNDVGRGITIDNIGTGWITGSTSNNTFPVKACVQCVYGGGTTDAIVVDFQQIPLVVFSDYLGGADADVGYGIVLSNQGSVFLTGSTASPNFPMAGCFQCAIGGGTDAFVAEYALGVRVFSTFMGGKALDVGRAIAFNFLSGSAYATGNTTSATFPIVPPCTQCVTAGGGDAFVAEIH